MGEEESREGFAFREAVFRGTRVGLDIGHSVFATSVLRFLYKGL